VFNGRLGAIQATPGLFTNIENVLVVPGARFGVFLAFSTLLNHGDEVIIIEPSWPAYRQCAINAGVKIRSIKTTLENKWEPSLEQINASLNNNTKMIVLNYPNNPTGKILSKELQDSIVDLFTAGFLAVFEIR